MAQLSPIGWKKKHNAISSRLRELIYGDDAFDRLDDADDSLFYSVDRMVNHLDERALATVEQLVGSLITEPEPVILDLMASWDSHIPPEVRPARVVGLGLNSRELEANATLTEHLVHDLNSLPKLPFADESFDVVLNTASVEYLTRPFQVFREIGRVLKPGGLVLITFSDRMFPDKAVAVWREASEQERIMIVEDYLGHARCFTPARLWVSQGLPRPADDRYRALSQTSDPVYAVAAERRGGNPWSRPFPAAPVVARYSQEQVRQRKAAVGRTLRCPHCDEPLERWAVAQTPFTSFSAEHVFLCANRQCPFLVQGWQAMSQLGVPGCSSRFLYDPERDRCTAVPVTSVNELSHLLSEVSPSSDDS